MMKMFCILCLLLCMHAHASSATTDSGGHVRNKNIKWSMINNRQTIYIFKKTWALCHIIHRYTCVWRLVLRRAITTVEAAGSKAVQSKISVSIIPEICIMIMIYSDRDQFYYLTLIFSLPVGGGGWVGGGTLVPPPHPPSHPPSAKFSSLALLTNSQFSLTSLQKDKWTSLCYCK